MLDNLEKTLASPALNYMKNLIKELKEKDDVDLIKREIELYCLAPWKNENDEYINLQQKHKSVLAEEFRNSYESNIESHRSKRYILYPKCPKHRAKILNLCN